MKKLTFDTNCLIDLAQNTAERADFIKQIIEGHRVGAVHTAFVAVSASERQVSDQFLVTYDDFQQRLKGLGVDDLPQIEGLMYWGISYWDHAIWGPDDGLERKIHDLLFPSIEFSWKDYAKGRGLSLDESFTQQARKWRNEWCDRQMIWAHLHHQRDVFVTSDRNFKRKLVGQTGFESLVVATPKEAALLV